jgi:DNA helicase II / ATP-dependent DNA helicase PcrA
MQPATSSRTNAVTEAPRGLESDPIGAAIVAEELRLLKTVCDALDAAEAKGGTTTQDDTRMLELREDVSTAKPEDLPALFEQMHTLGALRAQRGRGAVGEIDRKSPYFGHLRLEETFPGEKKPRRRDVLVGGKSYLDSQAGIRIVDWRNAPVSRIFYRYREEDDYEETFSDNKTIEGTVVVRRSVAIHNRELLRVTSPQGTWVRSESGVWHKSEGYVAKLRPKASGTATTPNEAIRGENGRETRVLPAIASMLDKAQFELITKEASGLIVIQGSAGSGKTTVGLHRVAYLHETAPQRFRADRMMVVVPNEALIQYTGRVLPSLGVEGVAIQTFQRFATRAVLTLFPNLPSRLHPETPSVVARLKSSGALLQALETVVTRMAVDADERLEDGMEKWQKGDLVVAAWQATTAALLASPTAGSAGSVAAGSREVALGQRVALLDSWLSGKREISGVAKASTLPQTTHGAAERVVAEIAKKVRNVTGVWDEILTNKELLQTVFHVPVLLGSGPGASSPPPAQSGGATPVTQTVGSGQFAQFHEWCVRQSRIRTEGERDGEEPMLDLEDLALLLRTWQRLRGPLQDADGSPIRLAHLLVDEVQDSNPVELRVLFDCVQKDHPITLAGDVAQRMLDDDDDRGEFDWRALLTEMGMASQAVEPLKVSYRSTAAITSFARGVLGPLAHDAEPIATRDGPPVELFGFSSIGESVSFLADALKQMYLAAPDANVAIVARFPQHAHVFYEGLERAEVPNLRRVAKQDFSWEAGFDVTDVRQTKGLEFDEVVLVETNANVYPESPQARHALYVGATRAAHQLWCIASSQVSKLVEAGMHAQDTAAPVQAPPS